jgi:hypothetical protein
LLKTVCPKPDEKGQFILKIYSELVKELQFATSKNYAYDSYQLGVHVPARPLQKVCAGFRNITSDATYKPTANFPENRSN